MSLRFSPKLPSNGLILCLDANNIKSMKGRRSLVNWDYWTAGSGGVTGYSANGSDSESVRSLQTDPWGNSNMVWGTFPLGDNGPDGGWNGASVFIDNTKTYRFSVWMRRTSATTSGNFYMGTTTNGTGVVINLVGGAEGNPYWEYAGIGRYTQNQWYLVVGHMFPWNTTITTIHPDSGLYTIGGGKVLTLAGTVSEILVYDRVITSTESAQIYNSLRKKYGL